MRTPTPNMISDHNIIKHNDEIAKIHTQSDVTIAFLTRDPDLNGRDRPSCEFGVSNQRRNTNHIYSFLHLPYNGGFLEYCHKVSEKKAYNYLVFQKNCKILEDFKKNKPIYRLFRDRKKKKEAYLNGMPLL